jgi:hypothetical protein
MTGWKAITSDSLLYYALAGGVVGLAYLTRPEAFAYTAFFIGVVLFRNILQKEQFLKRSLTYSGVFLVAFLLFAAPYLIYLKGETGKWTISGKTEINTVMGDYSEVAAPDSEGETRPSVSVQTGAVLLKLVGLNLIDINKRLPYLVPFGLMVFVSLGLFATGWGVSRLKRELYLIGFCLLTIVGYSAAVIQTRYFYILLPIVFGWAGAGILAFTNWYRSTADLLKTPKNVHKTSAYVPAIAITVLLLYLLPLNFFMRSGETAWDDRPYEERAAGEWLRQNARPTPTVFSARKVPAFYAGATQVTPKTKNLDQVFDEIRTAGVEYVVAGTRELKRNPFLNGLEERLRADSDFERVYTNDDHPEYKISIYKRR